MSIGQAGKTMTQTELKHGDICTTPSGKAMYLEPYNEYYSWFQPLEPTDEPVWRKDETKEQYVARYFEWDSRRADAR